MASAATATLLDVGPIPFDVCIARRDSFTFGWRLEDDDGPINFTGGGFLLTVDTQADGGGTELFSITNSNTLDASGLVEFLPSIANLTQTAGEYFYDVQWTTAGGDVRTVLKGKFTIGDDISD